MCENRGEAPCGDVSAGAAWLEGVVAGRIAAPRKQAGTAKRAVTGGLRRRFHRCPRAARFRTRNVHPVFAAPAHPAALLVLRQQAPIPPAAHASPTCPRIYIFQRPAVSGGGRKFARPRSRRPSRSLAGPPSRRARAPQHVVVAALRPCATLGAETSCTRARAWQSPDGVAQRSTDACTMARPPGAGRRATWLGETPSS